MPPRQETLLILPTYNEAGNIERLIERIRKQSLALDMLIVDDNSTDGTGALADRLAQKGDLAVIHRVKKSGIGSAHKLGLRYAIEHRYRYAMTMDADFAHSPNDLKTLLEKAPLADVVVGSRYAKGGDFHRIGIFRPLISWTTHGLAMIFLKLPTDCMGGFRLYHVSALQEIDFDREVPSDNHAMLAELLYGLKKKGLSVQEVPVVIQPRPAGESKVSFGEIFSTGCSFARLLLRGFFNPRSPS